MRSAEYPLDKAKSLSKDQLVAIVTQHRHDLGITGKFPHAAAAKTPASKHDTTAHVTMPYATPGNVPPALATPVVLAVVPAVTPLAVATPLVTPGVACMDLFVVMAMFLRSQEDLDITFGTTEKER